MATATKTADNGLQYLRDFTQRLLREAELPHRQVTVLHRDIFKRAGIPWRDSQDMAEVLGTLSHAQLRALVDELRDDNQEDEDV
ncbi:hypothetical protein [Xanthomonas citri]|uniref:hypothetical protein n=1 Tax=Xanthomonas citri TaxID=346 RepID=UPI00030C20D8|nr:hypothetical protein [Xanthomonas citri]AMV00304.1 hypothetical protein TP37_21100 [Xanthomonas citri pv. aurantifolii]AMV04620.1 hypothetical protein TP50_20895 [Xanthomonas citri pv. aurantifolii]MCC8491355.1 hypothetical protein [Xanthomonas citri pv. fuscans]TBW97620.1 hypothetical protein TP47_10735 [Xanthomonas citri pv. aurantifolii]TBW99026.1 hypothetical protein TP49_05600 [Xanthomonas citri pv. aurantifolii]